MKLCLSLLPDNTEHILFYVAYIIMSRKADFFLQNLCKNILYITLGFETIYYEQQIKKIQMNNHAKMETDKTILISNDKSCSSWTYGRFD